MIRVILCLILIVNSCWGQFIPFPGPARTRNIPSGAGFVLISNNGASADNVTINSTGADLIIVVVSVDAGASGGPANTQINDNVGGNSNTCWGPAGSWNVAQAVAGHPTTEIWSCHNPTFTGVTHTITIGQAASFPSIYAAAYSGSGMGTVLDQISSGTDTGVTISPGSITPSQNCELVISSTADDTGAVDVVDGSMTLLNALGTVGGSNGGAFAQSIQTVATAINPVWAVGVGGVKTSAIASYRSNSTTCTGGGGGTFTLQAHEIVGATSLTGSAVTPAMNCAGSHMLYVVKVADGNATTGITLSDSSGHTFSHTSDYFDSGGGASAHVGVWYAADITGSATEVFTASSAYISIQASCYSGGTSPSFDQESGTTTGACYVCQLTAITPAVTKELMVVTAGLEAGVPVVGVDSGFTIIDQIGILGGQHFGLAGIDKIKTDASAESPSVTVSPTSSGSAMMASFRPGGGGSGPISIINSGSASGMGSPSTATVSGLNCSGATTYHIIIVAGAPASSIPSATVTDGQSHTYTLIPTVGGLSTAYVEDTTSLGAATHYYVENIVGSASESFSVTAQYPSIVAVCTAHQAVSSTLDTTHGINSCASLTACTGGAVAPAATGEIVFSDVLWAKTTAGTLTVDSGFTILQTLPLVSTMSFGIGVAYKVVTGTATQNPSWGDVDHGAVLNVAFK